MATEFSGGTGGDLSSDGNWVGGEAPLPSDDALFALSGVNNYFASLNLTYNSATFRDGDNSLAMNGNTLTLNNGFTVGDTTTQVTLALTSGIIDSTNGFIASDPNGSGAVTVDGMSSTWSNSNQVFVGLSGHGTLNVQNGGTVSSSNGVIGFQGGSTGTLTVDGAGSTWANAGLLRVGNQGHGTLLIQNGALVTNTGADSILGDDPNSIGMVIVDGSDPNGNASTWTNTNDLLVGNFGDGTLLVQDGGSVSNVTATLAGEVGSVADVTVDGPSSVWTNSGQIFVGDLGTGTVTVTNGGAVSGSAEAIGFQAGSSGTVTVNGAGSMWMSAGLFRVGNLGNGLLRIENGGVVSSDIAVMADDPGSSGSVSVTGTDGLGNPSKWLSSNTLTLGNAGNGNLFVADGGFVQNAAADLGSQSTGNGDASIVGTDGAGNPSTWTVQGSLTIGNQGTASLGVTDGACVSSPGATIGDFAGSTGIALITGTDGAGSPSKWENLGGMTVGNGGAGSLSIFGGAEVVTVGLIIGDDPNSHGMVSISGDDGFGNPSELMNFFGLVVGNQGTGSLTIDGGGQLTDTSTGTVGGSLGSDGTVTVSGAGSSLTFSNRLTVGGTPNSAGGTGTMTVTDQGLVDVDGTLKIWDTATMIVNGGTIAFETLEIESGASFAFNFGTLNDSDDVTIAAGDSLQNALGGTHQVSIGQELRVDGTTTLHAPLTIGGGTFSTGNLVNPLLLSFETGTFNLTGADFTVGLGGLFGLVYALDTGRQVNVSNITTIEAGSLLVVNDGGTFSSGVLNNSGELTLGGTFSIAGAATINNAGLIHGVGRVNGPVSNSGVIEALEQTGELVFNDPVTNETAGVVAIRNSAVRFSQGLVNNGQLSFGPGNSDLLGNVTNTDTIGLSGDAVVSVVGDVVQNATLNLLSNSRLIVFDDFSGTGGSTGPGTLEVLGTLSPGASPAEVSFGGDLILGAQTLIELGGADIGQFDRLLVVGEATLGGLLKVVLIDGFTPELGESFEVFLADGGINDTFAAESLPDLGRLLAMEVFYGTDAVSLAVVPALDGDFDVDGDVDGLDFLLWQTDPGIGLLSDWEANYGTSLPLATNTTTVPEPSTLLFLGIGCTLLLNWSSRNNA